MTVVYPTSKCIGARQIAMKVLSLKPYEDIFRETEEITSVLIKVRNSYIKEALSIYNLYNRKKLHKTRLANLNPSKGTEPGKLRLGVIIQTDLLNEIHSTGVICPITTRVQPDSELLRIHLSPTQLLQPSDIMVDQIRAIDKKRLIKRIGKLKKEQVKQLKRNVGVLLEMY